MCVVCVWERELLYDEPLCCPTHYTDIKLLKKNDEPLWCPIHYYCLLILPLTAAVLNNILECPECPEDDWYLPRFCQLLKNHEMRTKRRWTKKKSMKKGNKYLRPRLELSFSPRWFSLNVSIFPTKLHTCVSVHQIVVVSDPIALASLAGSRLNGEGGFIQQQGKNNRFPTPLRR